MPTIQHEFNYETWLADTRLSLVRVPWDNNYRDVVRFASREALNAWIDSQETPQGRIDRSSYAKVNRPIRVNIPFNSVQKFNYIRASNPAMTVPGDVQRDWYYFILEARYIAPNTTELVLQLDFFQSYAYDVEIKQGFVERSHLGIANEKQMDNYGRDYLAVPEGFDLGSDYRVIYKQSRDIMGLTNTGTWSKRMDVLVVSTIDLENPDMGTINNPKKWVSKGSTFEGLAHGASFYVFNSIERFKAWAEDMTDKPWITQGILSITVVPKLSRYVFDFPYTSGPTKADGYTPGPRTQPMLGNWRNNPAIRNLIPARWRHLNKFFTSPYMFLELTTWTGNPLMLKPEAWNDPDALLLERATFTPPNQRIEFSPRGYNASAGAPVENWSGLPDDQVDERYGTYRTGDDTGDYLDIAVRITSFPTMAILNDNAILYMASNAHGLAQQQSSASWSQDKALRGNALSFDQASTGIAASNSLANISRNADAMSTGIGNDLANQTWGLNAVTGVGQGLVGGVAGGPAGMAMGAGSGIAAAVTSGISVGMNIDANNRQLANRMGASRASQDVTTNASEFMRDTNRSMADWASRGDYAQSVAAINARVQDAQLAAPSTVGQSGGETMNLVHNTFEVSLRWKMCDPAAIARVGEYWLRYGYAVERFVYDIPADMHVMSKFTYWKFTECYINNAWVPEAARQIIRGIFEKGVTVFRSPSDIGNVDPATNKPLEGISY